MLNRLVIAAVMASAFAPPARAQDASACLVVNNAWYPEQKTISILVSGYGMHYWAIPSNTAVTLTDGDGGPELRAASFTISIYDGSEGAQGTLVETSTSGGPNNHVLWTFVTPQNADERAQPACRERGFWLALVHG